MSQTPNTKRTVATVVSAVTGFAAVLGFHLAGSSRHGLALGSASTGPAKKSPPTTAPATTAPATTAPAGAAPVTTSPRSQTTQPAPSGQVVSAVGTREQYGYGVLSVKVTAQGGRITDVSVANLQTADSYSQMLAQQVIPMLRQEVLQAQGVRVNFISGATYTTEAYLLSARSAMRQLHV